MIEVFKTNIYDPEQATEVVGLLRGILLGGKITLDLEDCDKVLRIDHIHVEPMKIISLLKANGFDCCVMD